MTIDADRLRSDPESVLQPSFVPQRHPDALTEEADGGVVLWGDRWAIPAHLDGVAALLWTFLDGEVTLRELIADVADVFGISRGEARATVVPVVALLVADGYVLPPARDAVGRDVEEAAGAEAREGDGSSPDWPTPGPVRYHRPAAPINPALAGVFRPHPQGLVPLQLGSWRGAVATDAPEVGDAVADRWAAQRVDEPYPAIAYFVTSDRDLDGRRVSTLYTDTGRPLAQCATLPDLLDHLDRHLAALLALQNEVTAPSFRLTALERDGRVTLIQPEHLYSLPDLLRVLDRRGYSLLDLLYVPVDPQDLALPAPIVAAASGSGGEAGRRALVLDGVAVVSADGSFPPLTTPAAWVWALALATCPGHEPRPGTAAERLALARRVVDAGVRRIVLDSFDVDTLVAALD